MRKFRKTVKYLLPLLVLILLAGLIFSRVFQTKRTPDPEIRITAEKAADHAGKSAEVCGRVVSADFVAEISGDPTFLNFERPYPDQLFTGVIWGNDRYRWDILPHQYYSNRDICVTGTIRIHEGGPQIIISRPEQIREPEEIRE